MDNFNQDDHTKKERAAVDATTPKTKTTKRNFKDNSATNQCLKILDWLFEKGNITTTQARQHLDGWGGLNTNAIAERAGVNVASLYEFPQQAGGIAELQRRLATSIHADIRLALECIY